MEQNESLSLVHEGIYKSVPGGGGGGGGGRVIRNACPGGFIYIVPGGGGGGGTFAIIVICRGVRLSIAHYRILASKHHIIQYYS